MTSFSKFRQRSRLLAMCCSLLLLAALLPNAALAGYVVPKVVSNDIASFVPGTFQRAQLSSYVTKDAQKLQDKAGAVQLMPLGVLKFNGQPFSRVLPYKMIRMGVATLGNRLFVIGGVATGTPDNSIYSGLPTKTNESIDNVFSASISTTGSSTLQPGDTSDAKWRSEPSLPAVKTSDSQTTPTSVLNSAAVVAVSNGSGSTGYIYVIGGNTNVTGSTRSFSSYVVRRASVDANGNITTWTTLDDAKIPAAVEGNISLGIQSASAVKMTINGSTYIYLIGGVQRFIQGGVNIREEGSRAVFWAKVDGSGNLVNVDGQPGWNRMTSILPVASANGNAGLWDSSAIAGEYNLASDDYSVDHVIYLLGGQMVSQNFSGTPANEFTSKITQLYVDSDSTNDIPDGTPTNGDWSNGTLPEARFGLGAVTYRGKHYATGGISPSAGNSPQNDMLTSYTQDDMTMPEFGSIGAANFLRKADGIGQTPRAFHGMGLVPVGESAFIYLVGGQTNAFGGSTTPTYSDQVLFGKIGATEEAETYGYSPDAWYYSNPISVALNKAEIQEISWSTFITPTNGMDVQIQYRTSLANTCNAPGWDVNSWVSVDGDPSSSLGSLNGDNTVALNNIDARCFQYRAKLVGGQLNDGLPTQTPSLLNLSLKVLIPGSPDLRSDGDGDMAVIKSDLGQLSWIDIRVRNHNDKSTGGEGSPDYEPTLSANADESGGAFFVDLFIYKVESGQSTPAQPTIPVTAGGEGHAACVAIMKSDMAPDISKRITQWYNITSDGCNTDPFSLKDYFTSKGYGNGHYVVYVAVDSDCGANKPNGCVDETSAPNGEANNVSKLEFDINVAPGTDPITDPPPDLGDEFDGIALPLIFQKDK